MKLGIQIAKVRQQGKTKACFASAQTVRTGYSLTRWIPQAAKGMLPHFGRKIHHLHGISRTHNLRISVGDVFPGDAWRKWLWHSPSERHRSSVSPANLSVLGVSSPSMRSQLGCHPRSPTIQVPQNKVAAPVERPRSFMFFRGRFRGSKHNSL